MRRFFILFLLIFLSLPVFAYKSYYIKTDRDYNLEFLCFNEKECYNATPDVIKIKDKKFVGFGEYHYYDLSTYKYNKNTNTYNVDVIVNRDPFGDLYICDKCPYDKGNITHLIFSLSYNPVKKTFKSQFKGFISSVDIVEYEKGEPKYISINYLGIYYDTSEKNISDLSEWHNFPNKENLNNYTTEMQFILPRYLS